MSILEEFLQQKADAYTPGINRRVKRIDAPGARAEPAWQSLDEFRKTVTASLRSYMRIPKPDYMLLIPAPPGSGKTWAGVDFAHWVYTQSRRRVLYAGPRRTFFEDVLFISVRKGADPGQWYDWKPRQESDDPQLHTCNHSDNINQWLAMGYKGMDFCSTVCGWEYVNEGCAYHAQKGRPEPLIYGNHLHVTLGHPLAKDFAVVIGDELPLGAFVHEWTIPASRVQVRGVSYESDLANVLHRLSRLCDMKPTKPVFGAALLDILGGAGAIVEVVDDALLAVFASAIIQPPTIANTGDVSFVPANFLPTFLPILRREAEAALTGQDYPARLSVDARGLSILTRRSVGEHMPAHMVWFDATGSAELYEAMFNRPVHVLDAQPRPAGRIFQVTDRANGKGAIFSKTDEGVRETTTAVQLRTQIDHICKDYQNPGVISHMALEPSLAQETRHFYGSRGTNDFEGCDVLIVAGTPMPPTAQIIKQAMCLWLERMRPFDSTMITVDRAYQFIGGDGEGYSYPVAQFADADLNILLEQYRDFEIVQAAHRSRVLFRETDVYLLTNIPVARLPIFRLLTIRDLLGVPDDVNPFLWRRVIEFADKQEFVTAADLVKTLGISDHSARRYMAILVAQNGWEWIEGIRKGRRGPVPRTVQNPRNFAITL